MSKKILVVSTQLDGGCFIYADRIMSRFEGPVEILTPHKTGSAAQTIPNATFKYYWASAIARMFSFLFLLAKIFFYGLSRKYDGLLLFGITKWDYYILKTWKLTRNKSFVVIHDGEMHPGEYDESMQRMAIKIMQMATVLVFLSEFVRNRVKNNFGIDKPYIIAPHGLIEYGKIEECQARELPVLLLFGRISKYKGADILLDALTKIDNNIYSKVIIAGKWNYQIPKIDETLKVEIFDKWLSDDEIKKFIAMSDIMLFPYLEASQSGVATVAINYLKPSIVTGTGAFEEQFLDDSALFIRPNNSDDLAKAIVKICTDKNLRDSLKHKLQLIKERYSWDEISHNLEKDIRKHCRQDN